MDGQVDRMTPGGQSQHESRPRDGTADIYPASQSQTSYNQYSQSQHVSIFGSCIGSRQDAPAKARFWGKTAEPGHYIRLMKQGPNSSEACRIVGRGRKTGSHWRNGRTVWEPTTGRIRTYPALTAVREQPAGISARYLSENVRITIADRHRDGHSLRSIAAELGRAPSTVSR
jgi:hypothetical protein